MSYIKLTKNLFAFYSLESTIGEKENLKELLVITYSKSIFVGIKELGFICNDYRESDKNAYILRGLEKCCTQGGRCKQFDRMNIFLQDQATQFHETVIRLYTEMGYEVHHHFLPADIHYQNSCYIKLH